MNDLTGREIPPNPYKAKEKIRVTVDFRVPIQLGDVGEVIDTGLSITERDSTSAAVAFLSAGLVRAVFPTRSNFEMSFWADEVELISDDEYEAGLLLGL